MSVRKFCSLPKKIKKEILLKAGAFVGERQRGIFNVLLYQLDDFYTEVYFVKWLRNPVAFRSFSDTNKLYPYLQKIDISSLMREMIK